MHQKGLNLLVPIRQRIQVTVKDRGWRGIACPIARDLDCGHYIRGVRRQLHGVQVKQPISEIDDVFVLVQNRCRNRGQIGVELVYNLPHDAHVNEVIVIIADEPFDVSPEPILGALHIHTMLVNMLRHGVEHVILHHYVT